MPRDDDRSGAGPGVSREDGVVHDLDYLTYETMRCLIDRHLDERSLMLDVQTRYLLPHLRETAGARARCKRAEIEGAPAPTDDPPDG